MTLFEQDVANFMRQSLADRLAKLTPEERAGFDRIFPKDRFPDGVPADKVRSCIELCDRTIARRTP